MTSALARPLLGVSSRHARAWAMGCLRYVLESVKVDECPNPQYRPTQEKRTGALLVCIWPSEFCSRRRTHPLCRPSADASVQHCEGARHVRRHGRHRPADGPKMGEVLGLLSPSPVVSSDRAARCRRFGPRHVIDAVEDFTRLAFDTIALCAMSYRCASHDRLMLTPRLTSP